MIKRNRFKRFFALITFIIMVAANALANILPINGITTGEVSDALFNLFAPAPITFAIWGLIYLLLGAYSIYQMKVVDDLSVRQNLMDDIALIFGFSNLANAAWIVAWHYGEILVSLGLIVFVLICLILIANEIKYGSLYGKDFFLIKAPFGIYFGWITVATIANVTSYLVSIGFDGFGIDESVWTILILVVSLLIGVITMRHYKDLAYGAVLLWAYAGIYLKHTQVFDNEYPMVVIASIVIFVMFLLAWTIQAIKKLKAD